MNFSISTDESIIKTDIIITSQQSQESDIFGINLGYIQNLLRVTRDNHKVVITLIITCK